MYRGHNYENDLNIIIFENLRTKDVYTPQGVLFKGGKGWMWNEIVICVGKIGL